jgi:hypothetical protein
MKQHWVMDYETIVNCFIAVFEDYKQDKRKVFVVHHLSDRAQFTQLVHFLQDNIQKDEWHISYNGLSFDSQITEFILANHEDWYDLDNAEIANMIYRYAQRVIERQRDELPDYPEWKLSIKQIDLFKMNHWDNVAKRSGLKWIQYSMDWENVEDMPLHHAHEIERVDQLELVIKYCINDVKSTKKILDASKEQLMLRKNLSEEYGINLYSASETRIAKELFAHFLCQKLNIKKYELKKMRTMRPYIYLNECILPYISFETPEFQRLLEFFKGKVVTETKGALNFSVNYKGVRTDYGLGGLHGAVDSGIYEAKEGMIIMSSDVTSFYPNLAIRNKLAPGHLPKDAFCDLYEWIFEERKKIPKSDPKNYVYKIILNSTYGLSNDENSFLYDPLFTMSITINGQLLLTKLYEMLAEGIPGCKPLMQNTDGLEMMIPGCFKEKYLEICRQWEQMTNLQLEHDQYSKMIIADVNNYIAVYSNPEKKPKCKGRFEWEDLEKKKVSVFHKNKSFLIIPKAIYAYFVEGIPPQDFLKKNRKIYDYCGGVKIKGDWKLLALSGDNGEINESSLQKICRFYVSNNGVKLVKKHELDGRRIEIVSGKPLQTVFNKTQEKQWEDYNVNEEYYLQQIEKEITNIDKAVKFEGIVQLELF